MRSFFGMEISAAVQYLIAFGIIFVLLAMFAVLLRRITSPRARPANQAASRNRQPRLGVIDSFDVDRQRQLILVRRDNVEHLLMIGGPNDVLVEGNIVRSGQRGVPQGAFTPVVDSPGQVPGAPAPAAGEPAGGLRPTTVEARQDMRPDMRLDTRPGSRPEERAGPGPSPAGQGPAGAATAAAPSARDRSTITAGMLAAPPGPARTSTAATSPQRGGDAPAEHKGGPLANPMPSSGLRPDQSQSDSEALAAMTKQLEEALQRPHSAARPSDLAFPEQTADKLGSQPGAARQRPGAMQQPRWDQPPASGRMPPPQPNEPSGEPSRPTTGRGEPPPTKGGANAQEPPAKPAVDPFSVDEIEAEFARLLGRTPQR